MHDAAKRVGPGRVPTRESKPFWAENGPICTDSGKTESNRLAFRLAFQAASATLGAESCNYDCIGDNAIEVINVGIERLVLLESIKSTTSIETGGYLGPAV